jgi:predicted nucleotidyltransferase
LEDLQEMLDKPVDLLEVEALENPYFLRGIEADRMLVYGA